MHTKITDDVRRAGPIHTRAVDHAEMIGDEADVRALGAHADHGVVELILCARHHSTTMTSSDRCVKVEQLLCVFNKQKAVCFPANCSRNAIAVSLSMF